MSRVLGGLEHQKLCLIHIYQCSVILQCYKLVHTCQVCTVLVSTQKWPEIKCPESQDDYSNKNSACVTNTSVRQENTSVSQESLRSEQETEMQSLCF